MSTPTFRDAADRRIVRMADGRTGRLLFVPDGAHARRKGNRARVEIRPGVVLSVAPDTLQLLEAAS
jgi:hypothetical protein